MKQTSNPIPWWQSQQATRIVIQAVFLMVVLLIGGYFYRNMMDTLRDLGLGLNFRFLSHEAGFGISEGIAYELNNSYARAFWVGVVNTIKVVSVSIVLASAIGLIVGLSRLSSNWLVRTLAGVYVETFRNVPLLLQLTFWYTAVILQLPPVRQAIGFFERIFISQRGLYVPRPMPTDDLNRWYVALGVALVLSGVAYIWKRKQLRRADRPGFPVVWAGLAFVLVTAAGWLAIGSPVDLDVPVLQRFNFQGGIALTPEFTALMIALSVYTGAFIAEVVRSGVQAVDHGQREAAVALGLRPFWITCLVILPQAVRVIIPPLTNQYLNLAKNSSLAVAIGYPELFNIGTTTMNQTGQTIPVFLVIVSSYLILSLIASLFLNWWNRRLKVVSS